MSTLRSRRRDPGTSRLRRRSWVAVIAMAAALCLSVADHAEARKAGSIGSRGSRTYQAPASTPTAPGTAAPIQRSTTPQPGPQTAARPAPRPSMFGSGFGGALMRGLLIGGLVGLLMGGGIGGAAGFLGLLLQVGLVVLAVALVMRLLRRPQPVPAGAGIGAGSHPYAGGLPPGPGAAGQPSAQRPGRDEIGVTPADLGAFERLLGVIQSAYGQEDLPTLKANTTPEMFGFLSQELADNAARGVRNQVSDVRLLQGDIAEAWREGPLDFASAAMRYAARDAMVDRASGRVVSGNASVPGESTEVWTFVRQRGGPWLLSAIQNA